MSQATQRERRLTTVVIGYGNELRGDDAVGAQVARAVATWELPDVEAFAVHQLTPELADRLAEVEHVIFVDACDPVGDAELYVQPIGPLPQRSIDAHVGDPHMLLTLTSLLYGRSPQAWLVTIPATDFRIGAQLSAATSCGMIRTLRYLRDLIPSLRRERAAGNN
jgi:hydrogenase maturation protease